ncbi:hypothetical protein [Chryseobacterium sp.]|uniref:hypothetical protein n=1 Tax=Chryseobacterium sp. TaxID=1871047 RepID=UPI00321A1B30
MDIISYSRSFSHYRQKGTTGLFSFIKPYRNIEIISPYDASTFKYDPGAVIRRYLNFNKRIDTAHEEYLGPLSSDASEIHSDGSYDYNYFDLTEESDIEGLTEDHVAIFEENKERNYVGKRDRGYFRKTKLNGVSELGGSSFIFSNKKDFKAEKLEDNESDYFENNKSENYVVKKELFIENSALAYKKTDFQLKNEYQKYRRKDSSLKYLRN